MVDSNLKDVYPRIASEWDYIKNGELRPENVTKGCNKKVWWICSKGHSYAAAPNHRTRVNSGCPYCAITNIRMTYLWSLHYVDSY